MNAAPAIINPQRWIVEIGHIDSNYGIRKYPQSHPHQIHWCVTGLVSEEECWRWMREMRLFSIEERNQSDESYAAAFKRFKNTRAINQ